MSGDVEGKFVTRNMCCSLQTVGVSSLTGAGMDKFLEAVKSAADEYHR